MKVHFVLPLAILSLFIAEYSFAQDKGEISGIIVNEEQKPFEAATVELRNNDSVLKKIATATNGTFLFTDLRNGTYYIVATAVGYKLYKSISINVTTDQLSIKWPVIVLQKAVAELKEVSVSGKKEFIEHKIDRTVVNVNALISNTGANALEVLQKSPGVSLDASNNIIFKGQRGVLVLIDDRPTYLSAADLANYLRSLPASALDKIELMDNPPARYEATGNAVINIKTKKSKAEGFNGSLSSSVGQSIYSQYSQSANLNYRVRKVNFFANASFSGFRSYRKLDMQRNYYDDMGNLNNYIEKTSYFRPRTNNFNLKAGADFYLSPKTTVGFVFTGTWSHIRDNSPVYSNLYNASGALDSAIIAGNDSKSNFSNKSLNLNYSHQFDSLGKLLTFDIDFVTFNSGSDRSFLNNFYYPDYSLKSREEITAELPADINIYAAKADYSHPLHGKGKIDMGVKSSYVNTDNQANYYNVVGGMSTIDYDRTNRFKYKENINAGYISFNQPLKRFEFQAGLRLENTNIEGNQLGNALHTDSSFKYDYTNVFPTAYLSYKLDAAGKNVLGASYGRRIARPYYQDLNPFIFLSDKFTYSAGNPYLRPQYVNNYKLSYNYKSLFSIALQYNSVTDIQNETVEQSGNIFINRTDNIGRTDFIGATITTLLHPTKWWSINIYSEIFNSHYKGPLYGLYLDQSAVFGLVNITNQFTFPKGWSAELSGYYITRRVNGQFINDPSGQVNAGVQKKVLKDKGTVRLNARDIFRTYVSNGTIGYIKNASGTFKNIYSSQNISLGITYTFGKASNPKKRTTGSSDSEQKRIKN